MCVSIVTSLILKRDAYNKAREFLGLTKQEDSVIDDALSDLKTRAEMIQWDAEKKKLTAMEKQLKDLRSEDAKTEDALDDISKDLGL